MVFCYKTITESPCRSPRKSSHRSRALPSSCLSDLTAPDYENGTDLDSIPEREWRLLAALARKREEEDEREKLAEQFRRMWQEEKEGRKMMETEISNQYKRFIHRKREDERERLEHRRWRLTLDQQLRQGQLEDDIRRKERKAEKLLAWREDQKTTELVDKAIEEEARMLLAAERRTRQQAAAEWKRRLEAEDTKRRADEANRRKDLILRESSRRLAISSALSNWETSVLRQQLAAEEAARVAQHSAMAALASARGARLTHAREARQRRARLVAARCQLWRDAVKNGCY